MAILKIARMGHPVLWQKAQPVTDPSSAYIRRLVADMMETMEDANGAGLAAPQVHVGLRLFVYRVPSERETEAPTVGNTVMINPVIHAIGEEQQLGWEGCLSIPGLRAVVRRWQRISFEALDLEGNPIKGEAEGFHARVIQHEYDHLDGILYPSRIENFTLFGFEEEIARAEESRHEP
jgi:peptide deformylase